MRVLIAGSGGVGGYLGAKLQKGGAEVALLARGKHLQAIKENGLKIIEPDSSWSIKPDLAGDDPTSWGHFDLIILSTKHPHLAKILKQIEPIIDRDTKILPILNGVDHEECIAQKLPNADILYGCIYIISHIKEAGVIEKKSDLFKLCWGKPNKFDISKYNNIKELFDKSGLRHRPTSDINRQKWLKYLFIAPMAMLTTYYGVSMDRVHIEHKLELQKLLNEIKEVAEKKRIKIDKDDLKNTLNQASKVPKGAKTSMQLDFDKKIASEIEALCGHILREAQKNDINTPTTQKLYSALRAKDICSSSQPLCG